VRCGDHQAVGATEVKHDHGEAAADHGQRQQSRQRGARLVELAAEHGAHRGDVEHAGRGHDQEDGEDMRQTPDDLVVHAGDDVAGVLHVERGTDADRRDQAADGGEDIEQAFFVARV
jgi:hypothetical protein